MATKKCPCPAQQAPGRLPPGPSSLSRWPFALCLCPPFSLPLPPSLPCPLPNTPPDSAFWITSYLDFGIRPRFESPLLRLPAGQPGRVAALPGPQVLHL